MRRTRPIALACSVAVLALASAAHVPADDEHAGAALGQPGPAAAPGSDVHSPVPGDGDPEGQTARAGRDGGRGGGEILWQFPPEQPKGPSTLRVRTVPLRGERPSANGGLLRTVRALGWAAGQARLLVPREGERVVRVGDVIGTDTVTRVEDHRLRLTRADPGQPGPALVVVTFDARGEPFVRVYSQRNPPRPDPGQSEAGH